MGCQTMLHKRLSIQTQKASVPLTHEPPVPTRASTRRLSQATGSNSLKGARFSTLRSSYVKGGDAAGTRLVDLESPGDLLGQGSYGTVHRRRDKHSDQYRVVKTVVKPAHWDNERLTHEAEIMRNLDHPHILRLFGWAQDHSSMYMIMEYCEGGELLEAVKKCRQKYIDMSEAWASTVIRQILEAIAYCHGKGVVHKDLKSGNILLLHKPRGPSLFSETPHGIVADLGLAEICGNTDWRGFTKRGSQIAGTASTMAPEVWNGSCGPKCDIWSLGCVLFELYASRLPFKAPEGTGWQKDVWLRLHKKGPNWHSMSCASKEARSLCIDMLCFKERNRPTARVCLEHSWIASFIGTSVPFQEIVKVCDAACLWPDRSPMQRAICLKLAAAENATSGFAAIFSSWDSDRNGVLSRLELVNALHLAGIQESTARKVAVALDYDGDGTCEYLEFAAACLSSLDDQFDEMLWREFTALDMRGTGQLTTKAMAPLFEALTPWAASRKLKIPNLDTDGDGVVNFEEFCTFFGRPGASARRQLILDARQVLQDDVKGSEVTLTSETLNGTEDNSCESSDAVGEVDIREGSGPQRTCKLSMYTEFVSPSLAGRSPEEALTDPLPTEVDLLRALRNAAAFSEGECVLNGHLEHSVSNHSVHCVTFASERGCCLSNFLGGSQDHNRRSKISL